MIVGNRYTGHVSVGFFCFALQIFLSFAIYFLSDISDFPSIKRSCNAATSLQFSHPLGFSFVRHTHEALLCTSDINVKCLEKTYYYILTFIIFRFPPSKSSVDHGLLN